MDGYPVRQQYVSDTPVQLLARPVGALLSVPAGAVTLLDNLGIKSVFDLGASMLFGTARAVAEAASGVQSVRAMSVSRDMIDPTVADLTFAELAEQPLTALRIVDAQLGQAMATALGTVTVRELAAWPPYRAARHILNEAYGFASETGDDPERPAELVPTARQYATERVQYDVLVLDHVLEPVDEDERPRPDLNLGTMIPNWSYDGGTVGDRLDDVLLFKKSFDIRNAGGIDVADIVAATLMAQPAVGAILTYRQSWFQQGLALGQLLHSLALAPGESTRIALVDWTRRVRATSDEVTEQLEALSASTERNRSISEVTSAVAREAQQGFSETSSSASAEQSAQTAGSAGIGVAKPGILGALKEAVFGSDRSDIGVRSTGTSSANSTNTGWASSRASSSGERTLTGEMMQNVADRTQQAANSTRNRRATAVTESSQSESEKLSTRVVTNYNHMHALSVLYFEVVQVYRVVVEVARATPALFLPMKLVSFSESVIRRYRSVIAAAGLIPEVRALAFARANQLAIEAPRRTGPWNPSFLGQIKQTLGAKAANPNDAVVHLPLQELKLVQVGSSDQDFFDRFSGIVVTMANGTRHTASIANRFEAHSGWTGQYGAGLPLADAREVAAIDLIQKNSDFEGTIDLLLSFDGRQQNGQTWSTVLDVPILALGLTIQCRKEKVTPAFRMSPAIGDADLIDHLEENALHYSSAIWRSLDAAAITTLLGTYKLNGQRLIEVIDPVPAAVSGNYLVFRFYGDLGTEAWEALKDKLGEDAAPREDMVPLPSGGVFAEAVLGRSNAAEKLDITRFWNWQDSPIPILPSEISPLSAGGKANDKTPQTGALEGSIVNIVNPPSLPDPAGLGPLYSAVANGNMFRDMSGLAQTTALVGAALQAAQAGAANATGAAGEAQKVAAQQLTEVLKIAAQVALAAMTGGGSAGLSALGAIGGAAAGGAPAKPGVANTPSNAGALINHGKAMDGQQQGGPSPQGGGGGTPATGGGTAPRSGSGSGGKTTSREAQAADVALTGSGGGGGGPYGFVTKAIQDAVLGAAPVDTAREELRIDDYKYINIIAAFRDLIKFQPPEDLVNAAKARGLTIQYLKDGKGDLNLDQYVIKIARLPKDPATQTTFTEQGFFEHVRRNFPAFMQPYPRTGRPESLAPYSSADGARWASNAPLGTVMEFTIDVSLNPVDLISPVIAERGLVYCTEYVSSPGSDHHWNFSTMTGPNPAGNHPVSGTRQFGMRKAPSGWIFYTRAVDRMGAFTEWVFSSSAYEGQDAYWVYFVKALTDFVNAGGGQAEGGRADRNENAVFHIDWERVQRILP